MIACPFCHTALAETAPPCPRCNLDLTKARGVLDPADKKNLIKASLAFNERFPQCRTLMIIKDFPLNPPLAFPSFGSSTSRGSPAMTANTARTATSSSASSSATA